jgi:hypothetical protein
VVKPLPTVPLIEFGPRLFARLALSAVLVAVAAFDLLVLLWVVDLWDTPTDQALATAGRLAALAGAAYGISACIAQAVRRHRQRRHTTLPGG